MSARPHSTTSPTSSDATTASSTTAASASSDATTATVAQRQALVTAICSELRDAAPITPVPVGRMHAQARSYGELLALLPTLLAVPPVESILIITFVPLTAPDGRPQGKGMGPVVRMDLLCDSWQEIESMLEQSIDLEEDCSSILVVLTDDEETIMEDLEFMAIGLERIGLPVDCTIFADELATGAEWEARDIWSDMALTASGTIPSVESNSVTTTMKLRQCLNFTTDEEYLDWIGPDEDIEERTIPRSAAEVATSADAAANLPDIVALSRIVEACTHADDSTVQMPDHGRGKLADAWARILSRPGGTHIASYLGELFAPPLIRDALADVARRSTGALRISALLALSVVLTRNWESTLSFRLMQEAYGRFTTLLDAGYLTLPLDDDCVEALRCRHTAWIETYLPDHTVIDGVALDNIVDNFSLIDAVIDGEGSRFCGESATKGRGLLAEVLLEAMATHPRTVERIAEECIRRTRTPELSAA